MKILFVIPEYGKLVSGGIARFYQHAISALIEAGGEVTVCVASTGVVEQQPDLSIVNLSSESIAAEERALTQFELVPGVRRQLAVAQAAFLRCGGGAGFDVVETTDWGYLYAPWLSRRPRQVPVVVQLHGSPGQIGYRDPLAGYELEDLVTRALELALLPRADSLQTPGPANAHEWSSLLEREVTRLPPAWRSASDVQSTEGAAHGLVASRLQDWKGPEELCRALRLLGADAPVIDWAGGDHCRGSLELSMSTYLSETYPDVWGRSFNYLGGKSPEQVDELRRAAKFVLHPSTWDCFPLAVVESMDAGKTVICSEEAGTACLISQGVNGFTYSSKDSHTLARLLATVSELTPEILRDIGLRAHATVADALDPRRITRQRLELYSGLEVDHRTPHPWLEEVLGCPSSRSQMRVLDGISMRKLSAYYAHRLFKSSSARLSRVTTRLGLRGG